MKMQLAWPALEMPRLGLASFRRRLLVRAVFLLLAAATLALAVVVLQDEKERSYRNYEQGFAKTQAEIAARLRHPAGQLALLNPGRAAQATPLTPLLLPFGALDFDDQYKAQQAVETAGCSVQYPDGSAICAAIGSNPYAGGFVYLVGSFAAPAFVARERGQLDLSEVHRAQVTLSLRGETQRWTAPFELMPDAGTRSDGARGRLTGFAEDGPLLPAGARPVREFRGWLWQAPRCTDAAMESAERERCARRSFFSIRLPVEAYREAFFARTRAGLPPQWPPADLAQTTVRIQMLGPEGATLFDSDAPGATAPFSLGELAQVLLPGEQLTLRKAAAAGSSPAQEIAVLRGVDTAAGEPSAPWLARLIGRLPVPALPQVALPVLRGSETIATAAGAYEAEFAGNLRSIDSALSVAATRMAWYVAAMLGAIVLGWLVIEIGLMRRVKTLTRRAAAVSYNVNAPQPDQRLGALDVSDLRGRDELGILAGALADLLQRVKDDAQREHLRTQQERDMWHAVGHEIMSPLQSLMVLHPEASDTSHRYVQRMQQAVKVLYGQASPSEALQAATLAAGQSLDLDAFLRTVAANAVFAGVEGVVYEGAGSPVHVQADEFALEDVVTHILGNAGRHRTPGTPITLTLQVADARAIVGIHNRGAGIAPELLQSIFEYGVSGATEGQAAGAAGNGQRGQGLFVAKTYLAKMGGTVEARNEEAGVRFVLTLPRASPA